MLAWAMPNRRTKQEQNKSTFIQPSKKKEDEVSVNKLDEVKVVVNLINQWTFRSLAEGKGKRIRVIMP